MTEIRETNGDATLEALLVTRHCGSCRQEIYFGTFVGGGFWEPDYDPSFDPEIWRHRRNGYGACLRVGLPSNTYATTVPPSPPIITLCGSTRFRDEFFEVQRDLTLKGAIVISVGLFGHMEGLDLGTAEEPSPVRVMLDDLHKRKIDLSNAIYVVNPGGYIGSSTRSEIDYAIEKDRPVFYMVPPT